MINSGLFSSKSDCWETPQWLFDSLDQEFGFTLDVCAIAENNKCPRFISPKEDGLAKPWDGVCWCNPPYGGAIARWVEKAAREVERGVTTVMLIPARTDTRWFHDYIKDKAEIRFLRGRIQFVGARNNAPFPSMVVIFRGLGEKYSSNITKREAIKNDTQRGNHALSGSRICRRG